MTKMSRINKVLASIISLLALSAGRDKVCRIIQYYCKYLVAQYKQQATINIAQQSDILNKAKKAQSLMGSMAMTRKILRFGPSINCVKIIVNNISDLINFQLQEPEHIVILKTLSAFFLAMFFICDHYLWLFKMGITSNDSVKVRAQFFSSFGWLMDCFTCIVKNIALYKQLKGPEQQKAKKTNQLIIDTVRCICDIPVAYHFLYPGTVSEKLAGCLGTVTSAIGIYQLWQ